MNDDEGPNYLAIGCLLFLIVFWVGVALLIGWLMG